MITVREAIHAEIERRLGLVAGVGEVRRMPFNDPIRFPALHLFDGGQEVIGGDPIATRYQTTATVEGYLEAEGGAEAHRALHTLHAAVVRVLLTEPPLGGRAETIDEGAMRVLIAPLAGKSRLCFALDLTITYAARRIDPALAP